MKNKLIVEDWGRIGFKEAWERQTRYRNQLVDEKRTARQTNEERANGRHFLAFCEHPHVYTIGKSGKDHHLLVDDQYLKEHDIAYHHINRGGDITYHGPGQLVVYPMLDLEFFFTDIHRYVRLLEEAVIQTMKEFGVTGSRREGYTGVWTGSQSNRKMCAIGVHMSRWVSMHGLAFNVQTDLSMFDHIVPCGIKDDDKTVTSMAAELEDDLDLEIVKPIFLKKFINLFEIDSYERRKNKRGIPDSNDAADHAQ